MKARARQFLTGWLALSVSLFAGMPAAQAQDSQQFQEVQNAPSFSQQDLDQMLAPIALYPDSMLTQLLMASTYPLEVVQAARWSRSNPGVTGEQAVRAVESQNWDPSVKSLVAFPQVLELMDGNLDWTERLGNAFLSQESQLWDTVQNLRRRADAAGNLQSNDQYVVERDGPTYVIESPRPEIIYVPYYDPLIVYGDWWWPGYAPMRWSPWRGYYARPGYGRGYYWGPGIGVGFGFFFGGIDWRLRHVNVINYNSFYYRNVNRRPPGNRWQHDPDHRRGVPYRNPALRQQFNRTHPTPGAPDARRDYRGWDRNSGPRPERGDRGDRGNRGDRGDRGPVPPGPNVAPALVNSAPQQPSSSPSPSYTQQQGSRADRAGRPDRAPRPRAEPSPQALEGVGRGQDARNASARGQASYPRQPVTMPQREVNSPRPQYASPPQQVPRTAPAPVQQAPQQRHQQTAPPPQQQQAPVPHNAPRQRGERIEQQK